MAPFGTAKIAVSRANNHGGKLAAKVSDAPDGLLSGWSTVVPVRADRSYILSGFAKGGRLAANSFIGGAALSMQFLDRDGQPVCNRVVSPAVPANTDWTHIATPKAQPPERACSLRIVAGLEFCHGTAWFDDLELAIDEAAAKTGARRRAAAQGR